VPFVGNSLSLINVPRWEDKFLEWKQKYGPVYTFVSGFIVIVTVNDYDMIQEMFIKDGDTYSNRFKFKEFTDLTRGGDYGVIGTDGPLWREQRRFALKTLRDFGLAKNQMQERILEEISGLLEKVNAEIDEGADEIDFHRHTDLSVGSIINYVVCGYRFSTAVS
jgi:cytochrome P450 family 33